MVKRSSSRVPPRAASRRSPRWSARFGRTSPTRCSSCCTSRRRARASFRRSSRGPAACRWRRTADGERLRPGHAYVAPPDGHLIVEGRPAAPEPGAARVRAPAGDRSDDAHRRGGVRRRDDRHRAVRLARAALRRVLAGTEDRTDMELDALNRRGRSMRMNVTLLPFALAGDEVTGAIVLTAPVDGADGGRRCRRGPAARSPCCRRGAARGGGGPRRP